MKTLFIQRRPYSVQPDPISSAVKAPDIPDYTNWRISQRQPPLARTTILPHNPPINRVVVDCVVHGDYLS
jgi:hypothetical protein